MGTSGYPTSLDDFATTSPTNLGDDDAKGRKHDERHDDMESAMENVQAELGTAPSGTFFTTVSDRLDAGFRSLIPASGQYTAFSTGQVTATAMTLNALYLTPIFSPIAFTADRIRDQRERR